MLFAQLDGNVVTGTLEAADMPTELPEGRTFVELEERVPHFSTYDETTKTFTPPAPRRSFDTRVIKAVEAALGVLGVDLKDYSPEQAEAARTASLDAAKLER